MPLVAIPISIVLLAGACGGAALIEDAGASGDDATSDLLPHDSGSGDVPSADAAVDAASDVPPEPFVAIDPCPTRSSYTEGGGRVATGANVYVPACLRVSSGSNVTIEASTFHPLEPAAGGSPGNPIPVQIVDVTVAFPTPGFYPFYCPEHVGEGMRAVVWVTGSE